MAHNSDIAKHGMDLGCRLIFGRMVVLFYALCVAALLRPGTAMADAPHDITANMRVWLDGLDVNATDTGNGGGTSPSGGISAWKDKSANGYIAGDALSYGAATRTYPTYSAAAGVSFNGTSDILEIQGGIFPSGVGISTSEVFVIATTRTIAELPILLSNGGAGTSIGNRYMMTVPWNDGNIYWDHGNVSGGRASASWSGTGSVLNRAYLYDFSAGSTVAIMRDGAAIGSSGSGGTYTPAADHFFDIGGGEATGSKHHDGIVSEVIAFSRKLKLAERNILLSYLAAKHANPGGAGSLNRYSNSAGFRYHVGGIGQETDGSQTTGTSAGLTITNGTFLAAGKYVLAGVSALNPATGTTVSDVPTGYPVRSQRVWFSAVTGSASGTVTFKFNLAQAGLAVRAGDSIALVYRSGTTGAFAQKNSVAYDGSGTISFTGITPATGYYALAFSSAVLNASLVSTPVADGLNSSDFKAIPSALIRATVSVNNSGTGSADSNSTVLVLPVPSNTKLYVGDIGALGSGPVQFTQGSTASGLTYTYTSLSSVSDGVDFSNDGGTTWTYVPAPDGQQGDPAVTTLRVKPSGTFGIGTAPNYPSFTVAYQLFVN
ncbi:MAG: hypothetical protein RLZZ84_1536 [Pseudomonadota bacterium]